MDFEKADLAMRNFLAAHRLTTQQHFRGCGLFNGHPPILFMLSENPGLTVKELAAEMQVSPAAACTSLKRMESAGLIKREVDENDHRLVRFYLTEEGAKTHLRCHEGRNYLMSRQYSGITEQELTEWVRLLEKMTGNLLAVSAEGSPGQQETEEIV